MVKDVRGRCLPASEVLSNIPKMVLERFSKLNTFYDILDELKAFVLIVPQSWPGNVSGCLRLATEKVLYV